MIKESRLFRRKFYQDKIESVNTSAVLMFLVSYQECEQCFSVMPHGVRLSALLIHADIS